MRLSEAEDARPFDLDRAGHDDVIARLVPVDDQLAAVHDDRGLAIGQAASGCSHLGGAGACAARHRQSGAPFPDAQSDVRAIEHIGEADIDPLWEQGVVLHQGTRPGYKGVVLAIREEDDVGIAHGDGAR
ncbi:hypothetical protein LTR94_028435, partial [Friedmanniomyces endolithicus]